MSRLQVSLILVVAMFLAAPLHADWRSVSARVCNDGRFPLDVAVAWGERKGMSFGGESQQLEDYRWNVSGWFTATPGNCVEVVDTSIWEGIWGTGIKAFLAFASTDSAGKWGAAVDATVRDSRDRSGTKICVQQPAFSFSSERSPAAPCDGGPGRFLIKASIMWVPVGYIYVAGDDYQGDTFHASPGGAVRPSGNTNSPPGTAPSQAAEGNNQSRGSQAPETPRPQRSPSTSSPPPADVASLLGAWTGAVASEPKRTVTLKFRWDGRASAYLQSSDGLGGGLSARIVNGGREVVFQKCSAQVAAFPAAACQVPAQITLNGQVSDDGRTLTGTLDVWFWKPRASPVTLTRAESR